MVQPYGTARKQPQPLVKGWIGSWIRLQARSLRSVLGAYKVIHLCILERESNVPPVETVIEKLIANTVRKVIGSETGRVVTKACDKIRSRVIGPSSKRYQHRRMPRELHASWIRHSVSSDTWNHEVLRLAPTRQKQPRFKCEIRRSNKESWERRWTAYLNSTPHGRTKPPSLLVTERKGEQIYENINKATCSLISQIRTEKIGLNTFVADRRVPGYPVQCPCGWRRQTAKHIIRFCSQYAATQGDLDEEAGTRDYSQMLTTWQGAKAAARWLQKNRSPPTIQRRPIDVILPSSFSISTTTIWS
jgi:hypothetical protein